MSKETRPGVKVQYTCDEFCCNKKNMGTHCCTLQNNCDISFRPYYNWSKEELREALLKELKRITKKNFKEV